MDPARVYCSVIGTAAWPPDHPIEKSGKTSRWRAKEVSTSATKNRRKRAAGFSLFVSTLVVCGLFTGTGTAAAARATSLTLDPAPSPVFWWTPLTFTGKLTNRSGKPIAGKPVELEWRATADQPWSFANAGVTDGNGSIAIPATITVSADWRLNFRGVRGYEPTSSPVVRVESQLPPPPPPPINQLIVDTAASHAGAGYAYGAAGPHAFDCSGFTQFVHGQVGIFLPRTTGEQRAVTRGIGRGDMVPGDLVFFGAGGSPYHVGIFAGGNHMWAAPQSGDVVRLQHIWTDDYSVGRAW